MSAADLLMDLSRRGIRLEVDGDRIKFYPSSAITPDLVVQLRTHKTSLLAALRGDAGAVIRLFEAAELWQAALDRLEGDSDFDHRAMAALRGADVQWVPSSEPY